MTTLSEFLLARLEEEIEVAQEMIAESEHLAGRYRGSPAGFLCHDEAPHVGYTAEHVVLDIEAKRLIVRNHDAHRAGQPGYGASRSAVLNLAMVYSDHPDWNWNWRG